MPASDNLRLLEAVGRLCFGEQWQTPMAEAMGVSVRTIGRWYRAEWPVQNYIVPKFVPILLEHQNRIPSVERDLTQRIEEIQQELEREVDWFLDGYRDDKGKPIVAIPVPAHLVDEVKRLAPPDDTDPMMFEPRRLTAKTLRQIAMVIQSEVRLTPHVTFYLQRVPRGSSADD